MSQMGETSSSIESADGGESIGDATEWPRPLLFRVLAAGFGVGAVALAELLSRGPLQSVLADIGFVGLLIAAVLLLRSRTPSISASGDLARDPQTTTWRWTIGGLGLVGVLATQSWFHSGTAIARGDVIPPIGTAWIARLFSLFGFGGSNLGATQNNQVQLPFASVDWVTHWFGGSGALAQRIWLSLLVAAILMASGALARSLRLTPIAGVVVAVVYFFNPMTMSQIGFNDVFLTAMVLLPALVAAVISYGDGKTDLWKVCLAFVVAAPFVGYAYSNPPLVGMLALTLFATPLLVWVRFGRDAAERSVWGVLIGGALLVGASVYWLIPSLFTLGSVASGNLSTLSAWGFTEARSTLTNGLWLNTTWGWSYTEYFPFARDFGNFPLDLVFPLIPLIAFVGLSLRTAASELGHRVARLRGFLAVGALGVILLSTGTRPPGNILFDPLYRLPYGWLLREPGRFLTVAALGYAILAGLLVQHFYKPEPIALEPPSECSEKRGVRLSPSARVAIAIVIVALASSFPLWTGAIVPGSSQGFPSQHVKVPNYWNSVADYLNVASSPRGSLLVLPADDFYQMPYTWYYGNDNFISNLLLRPVIDPSPQGYSYVSTELLSAIHLESTALLNHNWIEAGRVLNAIGTPVVLVRGDIVANFPFRTINSPAKLDTELANDPEMKSIHHDGPLTLYKLKSAYRQVPNDFATVASSTPDLNELTLISKRTLLVTSHPKLGHVALYPLPSVANWRFGSNSLSTSLALPSGWTYSVKSINSHAHSGVRVSTQGATSSGKRVLRVQLPLNQSVISDGNFSTGAWGAVGNCANTVPVKPTDVLSATTIRGVAPGGATALELSASVDSACATKSLTWQHGPVVLRLWERSLAGASPRICVLEQPGYGCAALPSLPTGAGWHQYTAVIDPKSGTTNLTLFLYADAPNSGKSSIEQYARISVQSVSTTPNLVVVATPTTVATSSRIVGFGTGFSSQWVGPSGAEHVLVDGLRNGWITKSGSASPVVPVNNVSSREPLYEVLLALLMALVAAALWVMERKRDQGKNGTTIESRYRRVRIVIQRLGNKARGFSLIKSLVFRGRESYEAIRARR
jgi:hypothetical protein